MSMDTRATMSSAPDEPKNQLGFSEPFFRVFIRPIGHSCHQ
ncbi:hypothetical protein [Xenorhabdus bovienii]|nr:hypothetical protein [Xenorhabdus bovienii]